VYSSADIAGSIGMSQNQAMQQAAYAQSISPMNFGQGTANPGTYGRYSEQLAHGGAQNMMGAASLGMGAMSVAGGMGMLGGLATCWTPSPSPCRRAAAAWASAG